MELGKHRAYRGQYDSSPNGCTHDKSKWPNLMKNKGHTIYKFHPLGLYKLKSTNQNESPPPLNSVWIKSETIRPNLFFGRGRG